MTTEDSSQIPQKPGSTSNQDHSDQAGPLILTENQFSIFTLTAEGEVLVELRGKEGGITATPFERYGALRLGAEIHGPKILQHLPPRPETALTCPDCSGSGFFEDSPNRGLCLHCQTLGWLKPERLQEHEKGARQNLEGLVAEPEDEAPRPRETGETQIGLEAEANDGPPVITPFEDGQEAPVEFTPHHDYIRIRRWANWLALGLAFVVLGGATLIVAVAGAAWVSFQILLPVDLVLFGLFTWFAVLWPKLAEKHLGYLIHAHGVEIRTGLLWRRMVFIPLSRIQHADVLQGPIEREFDLANVVIHTAGSRVAQNHLKGLLHADAIQLSKHLTLAERANDPGPIETTQALSPDPESKDTP